MGGAPIGAFGLHPHPYWIPILTLAAAQGTVAGLFAVLMGVSIQVFGLTLAQGLDVAVGTLIASPSSTLYFLGGAFVIGEIHDVHAGKFRHLQRLLSRESTKAAQLQYERDVLMTANARLRQRIEEEPHQLAELIDSTARIQRSRNEEIYSVLLDIVRSHCGATKASVIQPDEGGGWRLRAQVGWTDQEHDERLEALAQSPIVALAANEKRGVQAFEIGVSLKPFDPFYAVPLSRADGSVRAVVSLDEMPAQQVSPGVAAVFFGIAEWADASLALGALEADTNGPIVKPANIGTNEELAERVRLEYHRIERYGGSLCVACAYVPEWHHSSKAAQLELDRVVFRQLSDALGSETMYRFGVAGCYVVVHHSSTRDAEALPSDHVRERWAAAVANARPPIVVDWIAVDVDAPDPHSLTAKIAAHFQKNAGRGDAVVLDAVRTSVAGTVWDLDTLLRRAPLESALARETEDPCQAVLVCADIEDRPFDIETLREAADVLRPTDGVFVVSDRVLVLLLPNSQSVDAEVATTRLLDTLRTVEAEFGHRGRSLEVEMIDIHRLASEPFALLGVGEDAS